MIIPESDAKAKAQLLPPQNAPSGSGQQAPPPYGANPYSYVVPPQPPVYVASQDSSVDYRRRGTIRFLRALLVGVLIWFLAGILVRSAVDVSHPRRFPRPGDRDWNPVEEASPEHGHVIRCDLEWNPSTERTRPSEDDNDDDEPGFPHNPQHADPMHPLPPYSSRISFSLPADAPLIYFVSRGDFSWGSISFEPASPSLPLDQIGVAVEARYWTLEARDHVNVCLLERKEGGKGLGIYTPKKVWPRPTPEDRFVRFSVTVHIPIPLLPSEDGPSSDSPTSGPPHFPRMSPGHISLPSLDTELPRFRHEVGNFDTGDVIFDSVKFTSSNSPIISDYLPVHYASLRTSNGIINGSFSTTSQLSLITSNANINADVELINERQSHRSTDVLLQTSNALIKSALYLKSLTRSTPSPSGGDFTVAVRTSNQRTDISFPESPYSSNLHLTSRTSNAASTVTLHPAFEGTFDLVTSNAGIPDLRQPNGPASDPARRGRKQSVDIRQVVKGVMSGVIRWVEKGASDDRDDVEFGKADVKTSNGKIVLNLAH